MRAWCAWCQEEGKPGFLGERAPLDDPSDTHGICDHHRTMLLAALPPRPAAGPARPLRRMLLVLDPDAVELYQYLTRSFAGLKGVERSFGSPRPATADSQVHRKALVPGSFHGIETKRCLYAATYGRWSLGWSVSRGR